MYVPEILCFDGFDNLNISWYLLITFGFVQEYGTKSSCFHSPINISNLGYTMVIHGISVYPICKQTLHSSNSPSVVWCLGLPWLSPPLIFIVAWEGRDLPVDDKPTFQFRNSDQILSCSSPAPSCCFSFNKSLQLLCPTQRGQISLSNNPKFPTLVSPPQLVLPQLASPQLASPQLASPQLPEGMTSTKKCHHFRFLQSHPQILICFLRSIESKSSLIYFSIPSFSRVTFPT